MYESMAMMRNEALCFLCLLMAVTVSPKTVGYSTQLSANESVEVKENISRLVSSVAGLLQSLLGSMGLDQHSPKFQESVAAQLFSALWYELASTQQLTTALTRTLGVSDDFLKPLIKILDKVENLQTQQSSHVKSKFSLDEKTNSIFKNADEKLYISSHLLKEQESINHKFFNYVKEVFAEEFHDLENALRESTYGLHTLSNLTTSSMWELVKSTWQRLLAYLEEENSLETFLQRTPVKIINSIMNIGDEVNLINFLATKLDPKFAQFLVGKAECYLGPLRNFDTFYNFTRGYGMSGVVDYFVSEKFTSTMNTLSRLVSAYLENRLSLDLVNQYIDLISFGNIELYNFYKSILKMTGESSPTVPNTNTTQRYRRDVLQHITNSFTYGDLQGEELNDFIQSWVSEKANPPKDGSTHYKQNISLAGREILPRDSGYGGSGYGGGYGSSHTYGYVSTLDPKAALGALLLGTLLGFLIFRLLRGTRNGRRDIGDGSLSLWDSDLPDRILPWGSSEDRMKRELNDETQELSLPSSLRGDVWFTDPLVTDFSDDHLDEDDIAHHLNHLWRLYEDSNESACVHSHLCEVMANSTAHHLTGKDSSLPLLMASVSNLMGVVRSGQLVDHVTQTLVLGQPYNCPPPLPYCTNIM